METVLRGQSFAVEISGVDLSRDLSNAEFDEIKRIWLEHKIAVFRGQEIGDDALVAFTERFGPLFVHFRSQFNDQTRPEIMLISNIKEDGRNLGELGDGALMWQSANRLFRVACLLDLALRHRSAERRGRHLVL